MAVAVVVDPAGRVLPHQVGHRAERAGVGQGGEQAGHRLVSVVAAHHHVHEGVADQLPRVVGRGDAAEYDGHIGVQLLEQPCHRQAALAVNHPVQIDAEKAHAQRTQRGRDVDARKLE